MTIVATETRVEVHNELATALVPTNVLISADGQVSVLVANTLAAGDWVLIRSPSSGVVELDGQVARLLSATASGMSLEGVNGKGYSAFVAASMTVEKINSWFTLSQATDVDLGNTSPTELDGSRLLDKRTRTLYGRPGSNSGTVSIQHELAVNNALAKIKNSSVADIIAFRLRWNDGSFAGFGAKTAYSGGFTANQNSVVTGSIPLTIAGEIVEYAS